MRKLKYKKNAIDSGVKYFIVLSCSGVCWSMVYVGSMLYTRCGCYDLVIPVSKRTLRHMCTSPHLVHAALNHTQLCVETWLHKFVSKLKGVL